MTVGQRAGGNNVQAMKRDGAQLTGYELGDVRVVGVEGRAAAYIEEDVGDSIDRLHIVSEVLGSLHGRLKNI